jgi:type IV pilus assembly protein PilA
MFKAMKKKLKDQRGLTLIELLAVVVILGIIAAIAVPSIGKVIDNTKDKAQIANANQLVDAAKLYVNSGYENAPAADAATIDVTLAELQTQGLLDDIKDPKTDYNYSLLSKVTITKNATSKKLDYTVTLIGEGASTSVTTDDTVYYNAVNINTINN